MEDKTDEYKLKLLHYLIGEKGREVCKTLGVGPDTEGLLIDEVIIKLDGFCDPKNFFLLETRVKRKVWINI